MKRQRQPDNGSGQKNDVPWHLWFVGLFFVFIYINGIYDYFMMLEHNTDYYNTKGYGEAVYKYFTDYPIIPLLFWTVNVFTGLLAPILLLLRTRWAMPVALISAVSMLCLQVITFSFMNRWEVLGPWISIFDFALLILTFLLLYYCKWLVKREVLR